MNHIFLVFGYGIPKNILKDINYTFYLNMVFNHVYETTTHEKISTKPLIICSGGKTDMYKPYTRTEGGEMVRFFTHLTNKSHIKRITKGWKFLAEKKALSTLENFLHCQKLLEKRNILNGKITIYCEKTRSYRIKKLAKIILGNTYIIQVVPIDFDVSENRYLDRTFLEKKEKTTLKYDVWALQNPRNLKKYHNLFKEKLTFLRRVGPAHHTQAVREWWESQLKTLDQ